MTALLFYYFIFVVGAIIICLVLYKFFDFVLDLFSDMIKEITK